MRPTVTTPVALPEVSIYEHGILAHLGLTMHDIRVKCDGNLSGVHHQHSTKRADKFAAKVRTHLGHAMIFALAGTHDNTHLVAAVEMLLFALAVAQLPVDPSEVFLTTEPTPRLTICCDARIMPRIKHEVFYAAQFGCMTQFAPISFEHRRMEKVSSLGTFPSAFMAATAVALTSKVHLTDRAYLMEYASSNRPSAAALVASNTASRIRVMLRDAQLASSAQYYGFWSAMEAE